MEESECIIVAQNTDVVVGLYSVEQQALMQLRTPH